MVTQVFDDEIVSASKFRNSQSYWFNVASKRPVTVTIGDNKVVVLSRERVRELFLSRHYLESVVKLCSEIEKGKKGTIYPWLKHLSHEEVKQFQTEFLNNILMSLASDRWDNIEELLEDWKATAEAKQDKEFVEEFKKKVPKNKYIPLK